MDRGATEAEHEFSTMTILGPAAILKTGNRLPWLQHQLTVLFPKYQLMSSLL
jgi:maltodextrin utilization protein YvdJ